MDDLEFVVDVDVVDGEAVGSKVRDGKTAAYEEYCKAPSLPGGYVEKVWRLSIKKGWQYVVVSSYGRPEIVTRWGAKRVDNESEWEARLALRQVTQNKN